jgi:hypothetical protein
MEKGDKRSWVEIETPIIIESLLPPSPLSSLHSKCCAMGAKENDDGRWEYFLIEREKRKSSKCFSWIFNRRVQQTFKMLAFLFGGNEEAEEDESLTQYNDTQMMDADVDELVHGSASSEVQEVTAMATEDSEQQEQTIEEEEPAEPQPVTPSAQATLVDLLVKAFPDSMIQAPKIVIVGSQSSGKTKLIISMIFLSLIQHPHFTDDMGDILLKVFRTGSGLTTRRPIKVSLLHSSDRESCSIQFRHGNETYDFGNPLLPAFIDRLHDFSGNEIFESPLEITIRAYQLPNIQFTDMPGLRSTDVPLADAPSKTLQTMVEECIANKANTVVAVESALQVSSGGDDTSLLYPIME